MGSPELAKIGRILFRPKAWVPNTPSQAPGAATTAKATTSRERRVP